jgi:thioesterase domain-containing protein
LEVSLAKLWGELLDVEEVGLDDSFFELGGNSLLAMELVRRVRVAALDGFTMTLRDLMTTPRIGELVGRLQSAASQPPMLLLNTPEQGATPLFCLHGVHGSVFDYLPLARRLQPQWAVHGIQCRMLFNAAWVDGDVESMAVDYCDYIRAVQPQGPYYLLGWSLGGALALQVARELEAQGQAVAFVGLLDSYLPQADQQQPWDERLLSLLLALGADEDASRALCCGWQGPGKDERLLFGEPMAAVLGTLSAPVLVDLAITERVAFVRTTLQLDRVAMVMKALPGTRVKPTCWWAAGREVAARSSIDGHYGTALRHLACERGHFDLLQDEQLIEALAMQLQGVGVERDEAAFEV